MIQTRLVSGGTDGSDIVLKTLRLAVNGKYGDSNSLSEFTDYYKNIVQPNSLSTDSKLGREVKVTLDRRSNGCSEDIHVPAVAIGDTEQCIMDVKRNKAGGYDCVVNEHLISGDLQLTVHLSLLFTATLRHSFVPNDFFQWNCCSTAEK